MAEYKKKIEEELYKNCDEIINTIRSDVLTKASEDESKAFFLKMIGDYCRYIAESAKDARLAKTKTDALSAYQEASGLAEKSLNPCNSIRLGLALNFSVFHYEVMQDVKKACELGDKALQDALDKLDDCDEETFRDAQSIIELLRENLALWKEEEEGGEQH
jgi:14-3-3 protein epsilon